MVRWDTVYYTIIIVLQQSVLIVRVTSLCNYFTEGGRVELNWYEIGRVLTIGNETDYVYVGDTDIWPGIQT